MNTRILVAVLALALLASAEARSQIAAPLPPVGEYKNSFSGGISYGEQGERDASFWGWSAAYSRQLSEAWSLAGSLGWDRETESFTDRPDKEVDAYSLVATITYAVTSRFTLTTGLGHGIANDENPDRSMRLKSGDLNTGLALGWSFGGFHRSGRDVFGLSIAYEYNMSAKETSASFDCSYGWSF